MCKLYADAITAIHINSLPPVRTAKRSINHVLKYNTQYIIPHINPHTLTETPGNFRKRQVEMPVLWHHMASGRSSFIVIP